MNHATIKLGDYTIPLIGVDRTAAQEKCDRCGNTFSIQEVEIIVGQVLCSDCIVKRVRTQLEACKEYGYPSWYYPKKRHVSEDGQT